MVFNISGEISKKEVGLISIILMEISGAILTVGTNNIVGYAFAGIALLTIIAFIATYTDFFSENDDWIGDNLQLLSQAQFLYMLSPSALTHGLLINRYEQFYFRALKEKDVKLAEGLKDKIEELKKLSYE